MNRSLRNTLPKILLVVATVVVGAAVGRATQSTGADTSAGTSADTTVPAVDDTIPPPINNSIDGAVVDLDVLAPVFVGAAAPPPPDDTDTSLGLGTIVGTHPAIVADLPSSGSPELPAAVPADLTLPSPVSPTSPLDATERGATPFIEGVMPIELLAEALTLDLADTETDTETDDDPLDTFEFRPYTDPCAPAPGTDTEPAADCPDGTRSTVLPIVSLGEAYVTVRQLGSIAARGPSCPDTTPAASGGIALEVFTNAPGNLRVDVVDIAGSGGAVGTFDFATADADTTAWADAVAAGVDPNLVSSLIVHCMALDGLPANAQLVALVRFTRSEDGARAIALEELTTTPAGLRPPTLVAPVGPNQVLVSIAHLRGQRASLDAWVSPDGVASCEPLPRASLLEMSSLITSSVDVNELRARGYDETYRLRTTAVFWVPEGRSINVCARTFDTSGPSFRTSQPVERDATVVHSPDLVVPVVSVESVTPNAHLVGAGVQVSFNWARGNYCGSFAGTFNDDNAIDPPDFDNVCDGASPASASGHASNVVVTTGLRLPDAAEAQPSSALLPVRARACTGGDADGFGASCPTPPTEWYRVPLATVPVRTGICSPGLFESTCEPPTRDTVAGTVLVRVDWVQGGVSGRSGWLVEPIVNGGPRTEPAATPQLDLTRFPTITGSGATQAVNFDLLADRPVDWTLTVPVGICRRDGAAEPVWQSRATSAQFTVRADGFCSGTAVQFSVTLTDPVTGATTTYGQYPLPWAAGWVTIPPTLRPLTVQVGIEQPDELHPLWTPDDVYVQIDRPGSAQFTSPWGARYDFPRPLSLDPAVRCDQTYRPYPGVYGWSHEGYSVPTAIPEEIHIRVTVELVRAEGSVDRCRAYSAPLVTVIETTISEAELAAARDGIRLTSPNDAPFPVVAVIRLDG